MKWIFGITLLFVLASCGEVEEDVRKDGYSKRPANAEDSLFDDVMHGHDTAMAKIGKLKGYRKEVDQKLDSLKKAGGNARTSLQQTLEDLRNDLARAEEGMDRWMDEFDIDSAQDNIERRLEYLRSEKFKVDDVKEKIFSALSRADSLLRKDSKK